MIKAGSKWRQVPFPAALIDRVDAIFEQRGYNSRSEYARVAVMKQLEKDEELAREAER